MARYFRLPFADSGDKDPLPDETVNSIVSYATGYSQDYQRNPASDPLARRMERNFFNQLLFDVTDTLKELYETGTVPFITSAMNNGSPFSYPLGARVILSNRIYENTTANNTGTPPAAGWVLVDVSGFDARYISPAEFGLGGIAPAVTTLDFPLSDGETKINAYTGDITGSPTGVDNGLLLTMVRTTAGFNPSKAQLAINSRQDFYIRTQQSGLYNEWKRVLLGSDNLEELTDIVRARTNLSVYSRAETFTRSESDARFLNESSNLLDLDNASTARTNLSVYSRAETFTRSESDAQYLNEANNLSDLTNDDTARNNLSVYSRAETFTRTEQDARYLLESNNLSDLTIASTARSNLSVYSRAETYTRAESDGRYLNEANNLSDLDNAATARTNLGVNNNFGNYTLNNATSGSFQCTSGGTGLILVNFSFHQIANFGVNSNVVLSGTLNGITHTSTSKSDEFDSRRGAADPCISISTRITPNSVTTFAWSVTGGGGQNRNSNGSWIGL